MEQLLETGKKVLASGIEIKYLADEFLFRYGQKAEFVFYLHSGSVLLECPDDFEGLITMNKPFFIGIDEAIHGKKYACTAMTTEVSEFFVFERAYFNQLITEFEQAKEYVEIMRLAFSKHINQQTSK
jgi:CRP-like cAMP-binding protein